MRGRCVLLALWLVAASSAGAQQPVLPVPQGPPATFRSTVELVTLNVTVTDTEGHHVTGLHGEDFEVLEDGVRQEVSFFTAVNIPLDVILLIDTSSSMRGKLETVQAAARQFVKTLRPGDRGAVVGFHSAVRVLQGFTGDPALLDTAIASARLGGGTALYTGIYVALDHFTRLARREGEVRKSAIVLLSDGDDTSSLISQDDLLDRARRAGVPVYAISVLSEEEMNRETIAGQQRMRTAADFGLRTLARETGAQAFFPRALIDLAGVYQQVASELAVQYAVGYAPTASKANGEFRRVLVRVPSRPDARPRTRSGYYATGPGRAAR